MGKSIAIPCSGCKTIVYRTKGRVNEARKFKWKTYCSSECQSRVRTTKQALTCEYCGIMFERTSSNIRSISGYCSRSCAARVNNRKFPKRSPAPKACAYAECNTEIRTTLRKYCSRRCAWNDKRRYNRQELITLIQRRVAELGRIPSKREARDISVTSMTVFGTWNEALRAAGFEPNRSHESRMYKRLIVKAKDGHVCDSASEALVDNWMHEHGIPHQQYFPYPEGNCKADWAITIDGRVVFVEYFGLAHDSPRYDRSIRKKQILCRKHGVQLIEIYPSDLYPDVKLAQVLHPHGLRFLDI